MGNCCAATIKQQQTDNNNDDDDLLLRGVSVYYLQHVLLQEVRDAPGLDVDTAKVYELEPKLDSSDPKDFGLIRKKGKEIICPRDHQLGASYVDSISIEASIDGSDGSEYVGRANVMLSYTWGYGIKMIVDTLVAKCKSDGRDIGDTFIWICCLCNNQHRIGSTQQVPFDDFRATFYGTVTGVGKLWSLMFPWDDPEYLKRVWCVFEIYVANTEPGVEAEIIMPEDQEGAVIDSLENIDNLFNALSRTSIEDAEASREDDRKNILALVENSVGYSELNKLVNVLTREWIVNRLLRAVEDDGENEWDDKEGDEETMRSNHLEYAGKLFGVGRALQEMNRYDESLKAYGRCLKVREEILGRDHADTAISYNNMGSVMNAKGDHDGALEMYNICLEIQEKINGKKHISTAVTYSNIGLVMDAKGDLDGALKMYNICLEIQEKINGKKHTSTALTYNNVGSALYKKGDLDGALNMFNICLEIQEKSLGKKHVSTAIAYNNIGMVMDAKGYLDGALNNYKTCLEIQEKSLGKKHTSTAFTYNNIGMALKAKGDLDGALNMFNTCLEIREKSLGKKHTSTATAYNNIGSVMFAKGDFDGALNIFNLCLEIEEQLLGSDHPVTVETYGWIDDVKEAIHNRENK